MQARMKNPAMVLPDAVPHIQALYAAATKGEVPPAIGHLVHLRVSQINGCGYCIDGGVKHAKKAGETDERLFAVSAWRDTPYFTDPERAALALIRASLFDQALSQLQPLNRLHVDSPAVTVAAGLCALAEDHLPSELSASRRAVVNLAGKAQWAATSQRPAEAEAATASCLPLIRTNGACTMRMACICWSPTRARRWMSSKQS